jgi:two-component system phosphate regulon response regulator PhoB
MHITIIEDEQILSNNISKKLKKNWFNTMIFNSYNDFMKNDIFISDLYIIDISLIDWSWFDIIKFLRNKKNIDVPIIITSWYSDYEKKVYWLDMWADDYLAKPFSFDELMARIRALLRRSYKIKLWNTIEYNDIFYDFLTKRIIKNNIELEFTSIELKLIEYFFINIWILIKKSDLITSVWWEYDLFKVSDNTINVNISKIRKKLWKNFKLKTIINEWYILELLDEDINMD